MEVCPMASPRGAQSSTQHGVYSDERLRGERGDLAAVFGVAYYTRHAETNEG